VGTPDPAAAMLETSDLERFLSVIEAHPPEQAAPRESDLWREFAAEMDGAVADIIAVRDAHAFLAASGYAARFAP
jgi:hypothetical protein